MNTSPSQLRQLIQLALPILLTQLSQAGIGFVDTVMAGRYDKLDLAAVGIGSGIWLPLFLAFGGIVMATTPLVAQAMGANKPGLIEQNVKQGFWVALLLGIGGFYLLHNCQWLLDRMDVPAALQAEVQGYLKALAWGFPGMVLYQLIRSYFDGRGRTRPAMLIAIASLLLNIPLNYIFIFGAFGLPELGGEGCGWASAIVMWFSLFAGLAFLHYDRKHGIDRSRWKPSRPDRQILGQFLKIGLPMGGAILIETSMFSVISLLLAQLGATVVAAHQITLNFSGLIFMIPLSLSMAATIMVGQLVGAGKLDQARRAALITLALGLTSACLTASLMWFAPGPITAIFTSDAQLALSAAPLLAIAAMFQISDAVQVVFSGALRGYKDTLIPFLLVFFAYWMIGLPLGYVLGLTDWITEPMAAAGFWYGLVAGLTISASLFVWRFLRVSARPA